MPRPKVKQRTQSQIGADLQQKIDEEDALRAGKVPSTMIGSAWGFNRPKKPGIIDTIGKAFTDARKAAQARRNPQPQLEGAVDVTDIDPEVPPKRKVS